MYVHKYILHIYLYIKYSKNLKAILHSFQKSI